MGDLVKGQRLLAKLDDDAQRAKVKKSEAAQRQAAANLAKTEAQRERAKSPARQENRDTQASDARQPRKRIARDTPRTRRRRKKSLLAMRKLSRRTPRWPPSSRTMLTRSARSMPSSLRRHEFAGAVRCARDRAQQGTRRYRKCGRKRCSRSSSRIRSGKGLCGRSLRRRPGRRSAGFCAAAIGARMC